MNPGDVVQLISGGPNMTVQDIDEGMVGCIWFASNNQGPFYADFPEESLIKIREEKN